MSAYIHYVLLFIDDYLCVMEKSNMQIFSFQKMDPTVWLYNTIYYIGTYLYLQLRKTKI